MGARCGVFAILQFCTQFQQNIYCNTGADLELSRGERDFQKICKIFQKFCRPFLGQPN